jgi:hypothetical protein
MKPGQWLKWLWPGGPPPRSGVSAERRHSGAVQSAALCRDAATSPGCSAGRSRGRGSAPSFRRVLGEYQRRLTSAATGALLALWLAPGAAAQTVADPAFSPPSGTEVPVSVSLSCATPEAVIHYTLDGSVPTLTSPVFITNFPLTSLTMVRARAFKEGLTESDTVYAYYVEPRVPTGMGYYRSVINDASNALPLVSVTTGSGSESCYTIEERLPVLVAPAEIDGGGKWLPDLSVIRWGPYTNVPTATVSYRLSGPPGAYSVGGIGWADGRWKFEPPDSTVTIFGGPDTTAPMAPSQVAAPLIAPLALQAEAASYGNGAVVATTNAGYHGSGFVSFTNNGGYLQFSGVNGGAGGPATLFVRHALGAAARSGLLIVNGVTNTLTFGTTTTWTNWSVLTQALTLNAGMGNTIRLESSGSSLANVDEITVTPASPAVEADVAIGCATPGAAIYYTLDGTLPTEASTLYSGSFHLVDAGVVRARAFLAGSLPSVATLMNFGPAPTVGPAALTRSVFTNLPWAPEMSLSFTPGTGTVCQAYEETVPPDLAVTEVSGDGVWSGGVIRWGPYLNTNGQAFSYTAQGAAGSYAVSGRWSHDGTGTDLGSTNLAVGSTTNSLVIPVQPAKLPAPALLPAFSTSLPVAVIITNAVAGVELRYTTDGTTPQAGSPLYAGGLNLSNQTTLRVRAFLSGWLPSDAAVGNYGALPNDAGTAVAVVRTIPANTNTAPQVVLNTAPQGSVSAYTVTEQVPPGLVPTNLTQSAVWNAAARTLKWGPFANQAVQMSYQLVGAAGAFVCDGQESVDGLSSTITGQSNLVVTGTTDVSPPVPPTKLPTPALTPSRSNALPVTVAAACAVGGAQLRYTLDGTMPTTGSPLYTGPMPFAVETTLRVRAFLAGWLPSDAAVGYYWPAASLTDLVVNRTVTNTPGYAPLVNLTATPVGEVSAYTVTESVPYGITPYNIAADGAWSVAERTLKWGPFSSPSPQQLSYQVSGQDGTNWLEGTGSVDGFAKAVLGTANVVVDLGLMPSPAAPAITLHPLSQPVALGAQLLLYVEAVGAPFPEYQWRKDGLALAGATSQVFARTNFQAADAGAYDVIVSNSVGAVTSQVAMITLMAGPVIVRHPQSLTVRQGETAFFSVEASGVPAPGYQWRFNGVPIPGQASAVLGLANVTAANAGTYDVTVSNVVDSVTSQPANMVVRTDPLAVTSSTVLPGGQVQVQVQGITGRRYWLEYKDELTSALWSNLPPVTATSDWINLTDAPGAVPQRFYRVREQ